jgi:hypothetical protein
VVGDIAFFRLLNQKRTEAMLNSIQAQKIREIVVFAIISVLVGIAVFFLNYAIQGPMIQGDEGSYLANAAAIAGFHNDMASSYNAGYSILIAPAFWVADTPTEAWMFVKAINALLLACITLLLWMISRRLAPKVDLKARLAAVVLVTLYPMWVVMSGYSFAQIAFVAVFLLVTLVFMNAVHGGVVAWILLGIASGFLYWGHPTAVATLIAISISSAYIAWVRGRWSLLLTLLLSIAVMIIAYRDGIVPWLHDRMTISGSPANLHYPGIKRLLSTFLTFDGLQEVVARIGGHIFYLSIGTVGLIWLGLISLIAKAHKIKKHVWNDEVLGYRALAVFLVLSLTGTLVLSALFFSSAQGAQRLDHWMYGRYVEGVIAPILLIGTLSFSLWRVSLWSIPIAIFGAVLLAMNFNDYTNVARFNISAFWQDFWLREQGLWAWLVSGCVLVGVAGALPRRWGIFLIFAIFVYSNYLQIKWHKAASDNAAMRWESALSVRKTFLPGTCVGFDYSGIDSYQKHVFWFDFAFQLFDYKLMRMSVDRWLEKCGGPLFSYDKDLDEQGYDVYPLALSPYGGPTLWLKGRPSTDDVYPMSVSERSPGLARTLGSGWYDLERKHVWSKESAQLRLPVPETCRSGECSVELKFSVYGASQNRPVIVNIREIGPKSAFSQALTIQTSARQNLILPLDPSSPIYRLSITIPDAVSPKVLQGKSDARVLGIALYMIELVRDEKGIYRSGFSTDTPTQVGVVHSSQLHSDGKPGFLLFGPYRPLNAGGYRLIVRGEGTVTDTAWVDVVSQKGKVQHARFPLSSTSDGNKGVLAEGEVTLESPVKDVEVRVFVGEQDVVRLDGYELAPENLDETRDIND